MKRYLIGLAAALLMAATAYAQQDCPSGNCPSSNPSLQGRARIQVPAVDNSAIPGWAVRVRGASGTLVAKGDDYGLVLTAYHVVEGQDRDNIAVVFSDGSRLQGSVVKARVGNGIAIDRTWDIAWIQTPRPKPEPCVMASTWPKQGEEVRLCGFPGGRAWQTIRARVKAYENSTYKGPANDRYGSLATTANAIPGMSGGAIVNAAGELVSVVSRSHWRAWNEEGTVGPALPRIFALCSDDQFLWPFGFRQKTRDQLEDHGGRIGQLEAGQQQLPVPEVKPESYDDSIVLDKVAEIEKQVGEQKVVLDEHSKEVARFNTIIEEVKKQAEALKASESKADQAIAAAVGKVQENVLAQLNPKVEAAVASTKDVAQQVAVQAADEVAGKVASEVAATAVEAAEPRLLEKVKGLLPEGLATKLEAVHGTLGSLKLAAYGAWVPIAIIAGVLILLIVVLRDTRDRVKTGDKLIAEKLLDRGKEMAARTKNPWDDMLFGGLVRLVVGLADRIAPMPEPEEKPARSGSK